MRTSLWLPSLTGLLLVAGWAPAESLWARRDPQSAYLFHDYRARRVGDLLTIVVNETTEFEGRDKRELDKQTRTNVGLALSGKATAGANMERNFSTEFDGQVTSGRRFDGKANSTIDRRFLDRMTVTVVDVLPNGNLVVDGYRTSVVSREKRTLRVTGVVRPADIGAFNTVQSQFIADFRVLYDGRGPESTSTNRNWLGRIVDILWPF